MNNSNEISLKEAIKKFLNANPYIRDKVNERNIEKIWEKVMGKMIVRHTQKITIKNKVITIEINSASLRHELSFAKEKIKTLINTESGEEIIEEVRFK